MPWWTRWLVVVGLLSGDFYRARTVIASTLVKDRNAPHRPGRVGSLKHNSIANYYRDLHRPIVQKCADPELPQRVRDAAAIFTGTVRDMVDY